MQSLIERFQDLIEPVQAPPAGDIEEGGRPAGAAGVACSGAAKDGEAGAGDAPGSAAAAIAERSQRALALQQASQRITQNTMGLQKLRAHFQKVGAPREDMPPPQSRTRHAGRERSMKVPLRLVAQWLCPVYGFGS